MRDPTTILIEMAERKFGQRVERSFWLLGREEGISTRKSKTTLGVSLNNKRIPLFLVLKEGSLELNKEAECAMNNMKPVKPMIIV